MNANTITTNSSNIVSNVADSKVTSFVNRFMMHANKSAENVLEMCKVVYEAHDAFKNGTAFAEFCQQVGLREESAISKMKRIGGRYALLRPYMDRLPCAWTTLYRIAKVSDEQFERAMQAGRLSIYTKASELSEIFPNLKKVRKYSQQSSTNNNNNEPANCNSFTVKLNLSFDEAQKQALQQRLNAICNEFGVELLAA